MRAYEIYESNFLEASMAKMSSLDMARHILIPQYGFQEHIPDRLFAKFISKEFYITAQCYEHSITLSLFNRRTKRTDDKFEIDGKNTDFIGFNEKGKILNKIVEWTKQFSDTDPSL
jgi:hypothetical protein